MMSEKNTIFPGLTGSKIDRRYLYVLGYESRRRVIGDRINSAGFCYTWSLDFYKRLRRAGIDADMFSGCFVVDKSPHNSFLRGHYWVQAGELIVDGTADQFSPDMNIRVPKIFIVKLPNKHYTNSNKYTLWEQE